MSVGKLDAAVSHLIDKCHNAPTIQTVTTDETTISANGGYTWIRKAKPSGAIAIVGYYMQGNGNSRSNIYAARINGSDVEFAVCNTSTSQAKIKITTYCLCV